MHEINKHDDGRIEVVTYPEPVRFVLSDYHQARHYAEHLERELGHTKLKLKELEAQLEATKPAMAEFMLGRLAELERSIQGQIDRKKVVPQWQFDERAELVRRLELWGVAPPNSGS